MVAKRIVITGAGVGIGAETARHLAPGNRLILHYNSSRNEAVELQTELKALCVSVDIVGADLTVDEGCLHLVEQVKERFEALDVLVNNAGGMVERRSIKEVTWNHLLQTFGLNVFSTMRVTGLCTELLHLGISACVVNVTSIAMRHGAPSATAHGASKAAIDSFTRGGGHRARSEHSR